MCIEGAHKHMPGSYLALLVVVLSNAIPPEGGYQGTETVDQSCQAPTLAGRLPHSFSNTRHRSERPGLPPLHPARAQPISPRIFSPGAVQAAGEPGRLSREELRCRRAEASETVKTRCATLDKRLSYHQICLENRLPAPVPPNSSV